MRAFCQTTFLLFNLIFLSGIGFAQTYPSPSKSEINDPNISREEQQTRAQQAQRAATERQREIFERARENSPAIDLTRKSPAPRVPEHRGESEAERKLGKENWERAKRMLLPPAAYFRKYAEQLKDEKMALGRIFPEQNCDRGRIVTVEEVERCADAIPVKGGGSFYSFRFKNNYSVINDSWDIHFVDNKFVVGNDTVQSVIVKIGDVELEKVNKSHREAKFLADYAPMKSLAEIKEQAKLLEKGIAVKGGIYTNSMPFELNQTYILRSIAYRVSDGLGFYSLYSPPGIGVDTTFAFKVVGRENDGSLIFLWKPLKSDYARHVLMK